MATTKMSRTKKDKEQAKSPDDAPLGRVPDQPAGGIAISPENAAILEGDIDDRMAALLKDHQDMGARPKE